MGGRQCAQLMDGIVVEDDVEEGARVGGQCRIVGEYGAELSMRAVELLVMGLVGADGLALAHGARLVGGQDGRAGGCGDRELCQDYDLCWGKK